MEYPGYWMVPNASVVVVVSVVGAGDMGQRLFTVIQSLPLLFLGLQLPQGTRKTWDPGNNPLGLSIFTSKLCPFPLLILKSHASSQASSLVSPLSACHPVCPVVSSLWPSDRPSSLCFLLLP